MLTVGSLFSGIGGLDASTSGIGGIENIINIQAYMPCMTNIYTYKSPCNEETLYDLYVVKGMTQTEIAEKLGTSQKVIWRALKKMGIPSRKAAKRDQSGEKNSSWKGGRVLQAKKAGKTRFSDGGYWYVRVPDHPNATKGGYVGEHILVATEKYGRTLGRGECVHHLDMCKQNNTPSNLVIVTRKQHRDLHLQLELIAIQLYREGMVLFNEDTLRYELTNDGGEGKR